MVFSVPRTSLISTPAPLYACRPKRMFSESCRTEFTWFQTSRSLSVGWASSAHTHTHKGKSSLAITAGTNKSNQIHQPFSHQGWIFLELSTFDLMLKKYFWWEMALMKSDQRHTTTFSTFGTCSRSKYSNSLESTLRYMKYVTYSERSHLQKVGPEYQELDAFTASCS